MGKSKTNQNQILKYLYILNVYHICRFLMTSITINPVTCQYSHIQLVFLFRMCTHTHTWTCKHKYILYTVNITSYINIMSIFMLHKDSPKTTLSDSLNSLKLISRNRGRIEFLTFTKMLQITSFTHRCLPIPLISQMNFLKVLEKISVCT